MVHTPEIWMHIFEQLVDDHATLLNTSLVCRSWHDLSQPYLLQIVDLSCHNVEGRLTKMDWGETKVVYPQLHAKLAPPSLVSRQRSFLRLMTDRPTLAKHVKSFTWTLVWGHVGAKRTDREDEAEPTLLPIDRQTWNVFSAIINVTTLDLASIHDVWEDKLIRQSPPCLFPSVRDLRLCGWMHRGLVRAILDSIDTSKLYSLKLDSLDDEGALPGGGPIEQGTAFYFSKNINQGLISVYEELVIDDDLFERQEQSVAAIFPGPMWFPLRVLSSATSGSLSTIRLKVSPFDGEIDIRNYYTLFRQAASLIRNASSTLKSLTIIFGESLYLYNLRSERYGTHSMRNRESFFSWCGRLATSFLKAIMNTLLECSFPNLGECNFEGFCVLEHPAARPHIDEIQALVTGTRYHDFDFTGVSHVAGHRVFPGFRTRKHFLEYDHGCDEEVLDNS